MLFPAIFPELISGRGDVRRRKIPRFTDSLPAGRAGAGGATAAEAGTRSAPVSKKVLLIIPTQPLTTVPTVDMLNVIVYKEVG